MNGTVIFMIYVNDVQSQLNLSPKCVFKLYDEWMSNLFVFWTGEDVVDKSPCVGFRLFCLRLVFFCVICFCPILV